MFRVSGYKLLRPRKPSRCSVPWKKRCTTIANSFLRYKVNLC